MAMLVEVGFFVLQPFFCLARVSYRDGNRVSVSCVWQMKSETFALFDFPPSFFFFDFLYKCCLQRRLHFYFNKDACLCTLWPRTSCSLLIRELPTRG